MHAKLGLIFVSLATATQCLASFDLFITPDATTGGYTRFDPINRVALGSIQMTGSKYVTAVSTKTYGYYSYGGSGGGVQAVDNSTGERLSGYVSQPFPFMFSRDGTKLYQPSVSAAYQLDILTPGTFNFTASFNYPTPLTQPGAMPLLTNRWMVYGYSTTSGLSIYMLSGSTTIASATVISAANMSATGLGQGATFIRPQNGAEYYVIPYRDNTGAHRVATAQVGPVSFGSVTNFAVGGYSTANASTMLATVAGHQGFFVVGADSTVATQARIQEYDDLPGNVMMQNYTTTAISPYTGTSWHMANLVAPEPPVWLASGVGILALLRRRRANSQ